MQHPTRIAISVLTLGAALAISPMHANAQAPTDQACVDQPMPASLEAGAKAVAVTVQVPNEFGAVTGIEAAEESGIILAEVADLPRTDMADQDEVAPRPINMGDAAGMWTVWLNLSEVEPGSYDVTFSSKTSHCTAHLTVVAGS